jgi:Cu+-exporting ATPase
MAESFIGSISVGAPEPHATAIDEQPADRSGLINDALEVRTLQVSGMTCSSCVNTVERTLNAISGVTATVNFATETAHVLMQPDVNEKSLVDAVKRAGYKARVIHDSSQIALHSKKSAVSFILALLFTTPVFAISMFMSLHMKVSEWLDQQLLGLNIALPDAPTATWAAIFLSAPVVLIIAYPIHRAALRNFTHPTMDNLVSLGSLTAFGWSIYAAITNSGDSYAEVAATVITFVILGRFLEAKAKKQASSALSSLLALGVREVSVVRAGVTMTISITDLRIGDEFIVKPGERIPTDGIVVSGSSEVNNALITGESLPVSAEVGSKVIGGALNLNGLLVVKTERVGSDSELARITAMVIAAQGVKVPIQRQVDRISAIFVPLVTSLAILTFAIWLKNGHSLATSLSTAIAVIVIACPCALGLATPVALLVASGRGAQRGIVIAQPRALEIAAKIDTVVLDKTGTITSGEMSVAHVVTPTGAAVPLGARFQNIATLTNIATTAYSLENLSTHPVAQAIVKWAIAQGAIAAPVSEFQSTPGAGSAARIEIAGEKPVVLIGSPTAVAHSTTAFAPEIQSAITIWEQEGLTISVLAWDGVALGAFAVGDQIKSDAAAGIAALIAKGISPWLITGDNAQVGESVGRTVGIPASQIISHATPDDKLQKINQLREEGRHVLMVGDGVNDAAALAAADLSIAMGTGTETAMATSDITVMQRDFMSVNRALELSAHTLTIIKANLLWAFLYNVIAIPVAAAGLLTPMIAAAAMAASSLFVVSNSLRIN